MGKAKKSDKKSFWVMYSNAPIKKKLIISHGLIIVSTFVLIVMLIASMVGIERYVEQMFKGPVTNSFYVGDFRYALADIPRAVNFARAEATGDNFAKVMTEVSDDIDADWALMLEARDQLMVSLTDDASKEELTKIYTEVEGLEDELGTVLSLLRSGQIISASVYYDGSVKPMIDSIRAEVEDLDQNIYAVSQEFTMSASRVSLIMVLVGVVLLALITATAVVITRKVTEMISTPVAQITKAAGEMRQGQLSGHAEITYQSEDELGVLAEAMRGTMITLDEYIVEISEILADMAKGNLTKNFAEITDFLGEFASIKESFVYILKEFNKTLTNIQEVSAQVDKGSDEIATAANELAASTEEQASSVEELTATISTVSSMAVESAKQADEAYQGVLVSVRDAEEKRKQVQELQEEMQRIRDISAEIANIITAIEEIADQTSLLSLNASIEAARAGEAGRGFAVVADQIGKLATDSAQAAVSTKELIEKTVAEIENGNEITKSTAAAFENIIKEMGGFAATSKSTSDTAMEQAEILKQVEEGISQIAAVTQENAASAEQSLATSEELAARAAELAEQVGKFTLH